MSLDNTIVTNSQPSIWSSPPLLRIWFRASEATEAAMGYSIHDTRPVSWLKTVLGSRRLFHVTLNPSPESGATSNLANHSRGQPRHGTYADLKGSLRFYSGEDGALPEYTWSLEREIARARWIAIALLLAFISVGHPDDPRALEAIIIGFVVANALIEALLRSRGVAGSIGAAQVLALMADWSVAAAGASLARESSFGVAYPAIFLPLMLTCSLRFGIPGIVASTFGAITIVLTTLESSAVRTARTDFGVSWPIVWVGMFAWFAVVMAGCLRAQARWRAWHLHHDHTLSLSCRQLSTGLTRRELQILELLVDESASYSEIAKRLHVSPSTIKVHVRNIGEKLGTSGRTRVVAEAAARGLLEEE